MGGTEFRERLRSDPYAQAAVVYLAYGVVYLGGAIVALTPDRKGTFFGVVPWWVFYVAGFGLVCTLPYLVSRRIRWLALTLSPLVAIKALTLCWKQARAIHEGAGSDPFTWFFIVVAVVAASLLFRAGMSRQS